MNFEIMPLFKEKEFAGKTRLGIWKIDETVDQLHNQFVPGKIGEDYLRLRNDKRRKEFLAARLALNKLSLNHANISKDENGRPFFVDSQKHLSISHADRWAAAIIAQSPVGIDIENYREKIFKVAHKFCSNTEKSFMSELQEIEALTLLWSAKESVFKRFSNAHLAFLEEMELNSGINGKEGAFQFLLKKNGLPESVKVHYELKEDFVLTWTF